jgi:hypothetical protein
MCCCRLAGKGETPVTEAEWFACVVSQALLDFHGPKASQRKLRLFAAACCRTIWPLLTDRWCREAVEAVENFADGLADKHDFAVARETALEALRWAEKKPAGTAGRDCSIQAASAAHTATLEHPFDAARRCARHVALAAPDNAELLQCRLLRDILGNPFRPVDLDPSWLRWQDRGLQRKARAIYDERRFEELPALGDALQQAGCTDAAVLAHCREPGEHVRGCWVVDLLLGKK